MVGAVIAVGRGKISVDDVAFMLDKPNPYGGWNDRAQTATPGGLYLLDVEYDERSFETGWIPDKPWSRTQYLFPKLPVVEVTDSSGDSVPVDGGERQTRSG
jgi:hypothetical protein